MFPLSKRAVGVLLALTMALLTACGSGTSSPSQETCELNSDCSNPEAACVGGVCKVECAEDRDCGEGELCEMSVCVSGATACRSDQDCTFDRECVQGVCVEIEGYCERNRDCPEGEACSGRTFRCIDTPGFGGGCSDDGDCFAEEVCVQGRCEMGASVECLRNSDCRADEICQGNTCVPDPDACQRDSDCPQGQICLGGQCAAECVEDRDCGDGQVCQGGSCQADPDANNNPGPVCGDGRCEAPETAANCARDCQDPPTSCANDPNACEVFQECCEGVCVDRGTCPDEYWSICTARADCSNQLCVGDPIEMVGHCTEVCTTRNDCPQSPVSLCIGPQHIITNQAMGDALIGLCFADDTGTACNPQAPNNCFDGICLDRRSDGRGQCSLRCRNAADCRPGYACGPKDFEVNGQAQLINVCLPIGEPCAGVGIDAADQCFSGTCLTDDNTNQGICSTLCGSTAACPSGWSCVQVQDNPPASVCLPQ